MNKKKNVTITFAVVILISSLLLSGCIQEQKTLPQKDSGGFEDSSESGQTALPETDEGSPEQTDDSAFTLPPNQDKPGWTQTAGPLGGTVIRMIPHHGTVWASLYSGGIYELQKKEGWWKQIAIGRGIPENRAFDIVEDPSDTRIVYVPEMIACAARTTNNGGNWEGLCRQIMRDIQADNFNSHTLAVDPDDHQIVYLPGHTHDQTSMLVVSNDGGEHWEKRFVFDKHYDFNHVLFFDSKMYLGTVDDGVFVSSDKGKSWVAFNDGLESLATGRFLVFKNRLYLLGARLQYNTRTGGSLYRLANDGLSWEKVPELQEVFHEVTGLGTDGTTLFIGTWDPDPTLWASTDGTSFQRAESKGLPRDWIGEIVPLDGKIYVGAGGNGVYVSPDNGNTFEELNRGIVSIATREVHVNPDDGNEIYVGTWDRLGFYWSKNGGEGYRRVATDHFVLALTPDPHDFSRVYLGGEGFFVGTVSTNARSQFTQKNKPGSATTFIEAIAIDPSNSNHILTGVGAEVAETPPGEGVWESNDGGESWTRSEGIGNFAVYSIIFNPHNPQRVYASALGGGVFKSVDGGRRFTPLGVDEQLKYTYRLAMSPTDPDVIIASSNTFFGQLSSEEQISGKYGGIFQSRDGGATWKEITKGIRNYEGGEREEDFLGWLYNFGHLPNYENILIDPKNPDHLVVGHHGENVVETTDGGATWKKAGANEMVPGGIHNYAYCLGASSNFEKFYACTCGRGLFRGITNKNGYISLSITGNVVYRGDAVDSGPARNAREARESILSGEYNHEH
ncbi:hypothetical protein HY572_01010 [Candidatus Micrarchaeota archaeon]|nr:hypothetical protein [Candidatus Micrarchaeota archaeon]